MIGKCIQSVHAELFFFALPVPVVYCHCRFLPPYCFFSPGMLYFIMLFYLLQAVFFC